MENTEACDVCNGDVRSEHRSAEGIKQRKDPAELLERRPRPQGNWEPLSHTIHGDGIGVHGIKQLGQICRYARRCDPRKEEAGLARQLSIKLSPVILIVFIHPLTDTAFYVKGTIAAQNVLTGFECREIT